MKKLIISLVLFLLIFVGCSKEEEKTPITNVDNVPTFAVEKPLTVSTVQDLEKTNPTFKILWQERGKSLYRVEGRLNPYAVRRDLPGKAGQYLLTFHQSITDAVKAFNSNPY